MSARPVDMEPDLVVAPPRQFGKYVIEQVLGEGAMGVVYKATDPHIHRPVAIKAIRAPLLTPGARDLSAATRFRTEAQAAGRLSHPNIVSVYEYGESGSDHFIAMEYVEGISLLALTAPDRRLPLDDALSVMLQLLDALACAHGQGVWHRDIKPANLLVTPAGQLKVTDFGIARIDSTDHTHHTTVLGSPGYMAPERYTDEAPDRRVDIFSCGVLLHELLTGTPPFRGCSSAVMYQVLNQDPPAPSSLPLHPPVPAQFDAVVARAIAKRPADRFADATQMREALCAAAERPIRPYVSAGTMLRLRTGDNDPPTQVMPRMPTGTPSLSSASSVPSVSRISGVPAVASDSGVSGVSRTPGTTGVTGITGVTSTFGLTGTFGTPGMTASIPTAPGWDSATLGAVEALLVELLGPMARLVVRDAARRCADLRALVAHLASTVLDAEDARDFRARAEAAWPGLRSAPARSPTGPLPVLGTTPMRPDLVDTAQRVLADHIGPIAGLLARRAAANATTREAFYTALADAAGDEVDRRELLEQLWKIA